MRIQHTSNTPSLMTRRVQAYLNHLVILLSVLLHGYVLEVPEHPSLESTAVNRNPKPTMLGYLLRG
jgi:hypothetical protein